MNNLKVRKMVLILNVEKKNKSNLYNFVDLETNSVGTALGIKQDNVLLHQPIQITLNIRISNEIFELKDGTRKFVNTSNMYIESIGDTDK